MGVVYWIISLHGISLRAMIITWQSLSSLQVCIYLTPTPQARCDMKAISKQSKFVWVQGFPSPRLTTLLKQKNLTCPAGHRFMSILNEV